MRHRGPNWPIAFASLTVSVMLWFVVYAQNVPAPQPVSVPLVSDGLDSARFFVRKIPSVVRLIVNAPADRAKDLADEKIIASVNLSSAQAGAHDYPVTLSPDWVQRYIPDAKPTVHVELEPVKSRTMPITSVVKGTLPDRGLQIASWVLSPRQATIYGPTSEVDAVREVRAYLDLSAIHVTDQEPQVSALVPLDGQGSRPQNVQASPSDAQYTFKIDAAEATKPATVVLPALDVTYDASVRGNGYRIEPSSVDLRGKPSLLANISKVYTEPIRAQGLKHDRTVRARLVAPAGTKIVGPKEVSVTFFVLPAPVASAQTGETSPAPKP